MVLFETFEKDKFQQEFKLENFSMQKQLPYPATG